MKFFEDMLHLENVKRWAVVPTIGDQSVADHTYKVMVILRYIMPFHAWYQVNPKFELDLYEKAMAHDIEEAVAGDMPSPTKGNKDYTKYAALYGQVSALLKVADIVEALHYAKRQRNLGNRVMKDSLIESELWAKLRDVFDSGIEWNNRDMIWEHVVALIEGGTILPGMRSYHEKVTNAGS